MSAVAQTLQRAREAAGLSVEAMGKLVGVSPAAVRELEEGRDGPSTAVLREYATLFGCRVEQFLDEGAGRSPAALLFRSAAEHGTDLSQELRKSDLRLLGKFLSRVTDIDRLERLLERPSPAVVNVASLDPQLLPWEQGRIGAERVREALGLGDAPVPSMVALIEDRLRWPLLFVSPDELSSVVLGASTVQPRPAILINLVGGSESWWRTRANIAHELCHVLFDGHAQPYLLSPDGELGMRQWALVEHFRDLEKRANAFAAYFLAPSSSLREAVARIAPDSDAAIAKVCTTFGVGKIMAIRRLGHEFKLSSMVQDQMLCRDPRLSHAGAHPDAAVVAGLRTNRLERLVRDAVERDLIDELEARSILEIPTSEPLSELGEHGAVLVDLQQLARARAEAHAWLELGPCRSVDATQTAEGWTVVVESREHGQRASVLLSSKFEPLNQQA